MDSQSFSSPRSGGILDIKDGSMFSRRNHLRILGVVLSILLLWNGVCDFSMDIRTRLAVLDSILRSSGM